MCDACRKAARVLRSGARQVRLREVYRYFGEAMFVGLDRLGFFFFFLGGGGGAEAKQVSVRKRPTSSKPSPQIVRHGNYVTCAAAEAAGDDDARLDQGCHKLTTKSRGGCFFFQSQIKSAGDSIYRLDSLLTHLRRQHGVGAPAQAK